jgi:hypothetical protein
MATGRFSVVVDIGFRNKIPGGEAIPVRNHE